MQFKVPQFIDVEDKLFGPFTFKQFVYMLGGGGIIFVIYKILGFWFGLIPIIIVGALTFLLVFYKINEKPFVFYLEAGINYLMSSKLYIWKQRLVKPGDKEKEEQTAAPLVSIVPMTTTNKLKDLSWSLDVQEKESGGK